jgi:hypothetical protein
MPTSMNQGEPEPSGTRRDATVFWPASLSARHVLILHDDAQELGFPTFPPPWVDRPDETMQCGLVGRRLAWLSAEGDRPGRNRG